MTESAKARLQQELSKKEPNYEAISKLANELLDENQDAVRFSVDALHINRLGLELVGKQETALSELIKNAFDADASKVEIDFKNHNKPGGKLVIHDDGVGMDIDTIRSGWMRLSTNEKIDAPISTIFGRLRAGKKGIGRFAVQRLGKKLILETETKGLAEGIRVTFDWDREFQAGKDIGTIWSQIEHYPKDEKSHGTKLIIHDLRDKWTHATVDRVWKSVLLLQPPHKVSKSRKVKTRSGREYDADPGFVVVINGTSSRQHEKAVSIKSGFLDHAIATITGTIDEDGNATFRVVSEKLKLDEVQKVNDKFLLTGKVHLEARYFIYSPDAMPGISSKVASEMGHKYGGVRLYRDGFRVLPYGETQDDWLKLAFDTGRRQLLIPANNQNFFGHVEISNEENPLLEETSSREGLIENEAFDDLRRFARDCLEWATKRVAWIREKKQTASQKDFVSKSKELENPFANEFIEILKEKTLSITEKGKEKVAQKVIEDFAEKVKSFERARVEEREESLKYEAMLRILASLGLSVSIFSHEIKGAFDIVNTSLVLLRRQIPKVNPPEVQKIIGEKSGQVHVAVNKVFDLGGYLSSMMSGTESRTLKSASIRGVLEVFVKQFSEFMGKHNITFELGDVSPSGLRTCKIHRSEIDSVLFNFLTNSVKALDASKQKNRKVKVSAFEDGQDVVIRFEDNGHGVPEKIKDRIFDAFFTTSQNSQDEVAGAGTGLGLKIISDIASSYGGGVSLEKPSKGYECCFEFRIPSNDKKVINK